MDQHKALLPFHGGVLAQAIAGPSHQSQPLCAVYHRRVVEGLYTAFSRGWRIAALEDVLLVRESVPLENVNTPADCAAYARG